MLHYFLVAVHAVQRCLCPQANTSTVCAAVAVHNPLEYQCICTTPDDVGSAKLYMLSVYILHQSSALLQGKVSVAWQELDRLHSCSTGPIPRSGT